VQAILWLKDSLGNLGSSGRKERSSSFVHDFHQKQLVIILWTHPRATMGLVMTAESQLFSTLFPSSGCREQLPPAQGQIGQGCQHIDLAAVLGQATQPRLPKTELLLDEAKWVLLLDRIWALAVSIRSSSLPSGVSGRALH
jgi:hypothetical protein